jgi:hypothetical protein
MAKRRIVKTGTSENPDSFNVSGGEPETGTGGKNVESDVDLSPRLNLPLTGDGFFNIGTMQARNRDKLIKALSDPNLSAALGVDVPKPGAASAQGVGIPPSLLAPLFEGLGNFAVAFAAKTYPAQIAALAALSADECMALATPSAKVIDKHFPNVLGKYQEEGELAAAAVMIVMTKLAVLKAAASAAGIQAPAPSEPEPALIVN